MRPSAIVAEAYASGKIKLFEFLIDATQMPVILQENYGFRYILQKMNFSFQYGEIHTAVLPPFYAQIHLRRCCLCYNYAFDFQFFRKNQIFVCRSTGFLALLDIDRHNLCTDRSTTPSYYPATVEYALPCLKQTPISGLWLFTKPYPIEIMLMRHPLFRLKWELTPLGSPKQ